MLQRLNTLLLGLSLAIAAGAAGAEDPRFTLSFGGEPGAPLAHAYNYGPPKDGAPSYVMRIPLVNPKLNVIFSDVALTVRASDQHVLRVDAERAYDSLVKCSAVLDVVRKELSSVLPAPHAGDTALWQRQSADGRVIGGAYCRQERHLPFPILTLALDLAAPP